MGKEIETINKSDDETVNVRMSQRREKENKELVANVKRGANMENK
jgi:hypothetical protein